jgi:AbrB family looped-hinge helix DNA binding protein
MPHYSRSQTPRSLGRITYKGQLTIPKEVREAIGLEDGDLVEIRADPRDGSVIVTPKALIDKNQAWFWTPEWQSKEREAEKDLQAGRFRRFKNLNDLLKDLRSR